MVAFASDTQQLTGTTGTVTLVICIAVSIATIAMLVAVWRNKGIRS